MYCSSLTHSLNTTCLDQSQVATLQREKVSLTSKVGELEGEVKKLQRDLDKETEKAMAMTQVDHTH